MINTWIITFIYLLNLIKGFEIPSKDFTQRKYFAVESPLNVTQLLQKYPRWSFEHDVRGLENHYVFSQSISDMNKRHYQDIANDDDIIFNEDVTMSRILKRAPPIDSSMLEIKDVEEQLNITDPFFERQWHLFNPSFPGNDINLKKSWYNDITGKGVVVAIVDDGLDYDNEDIKSNFCEKGSWDFNDNTKLPKPRLSDDYHGTRCAGEIAASKNEGKCGVGVAYDANVAGIRILSGELTTEDEAASLVYGLDVNDIYSCSWGPSDDGKHLQGPSDLVRKALIKGTNEGRNNRGSIYVFASGNGGHLGDNCNYDGYTNSIYSITIGAIDHKGLHPPYSEGCSAVMAVTYSSGSSEFIHTTDLHEQCSNNHGGTSAAAPLAAGIYALLLQANPNLTWRDVQYLTLLSSDEIKNSDANSQNGALGKRYSHRYGYGKLDASKLVEMAKDWKNVNPQAWYFTEIQQVKNVTNDVDILESKVDITKENLKNANLKRVEHLTVTVDIAANIRGNIIIDLISPSGMVSNLGVVRQRDTSNEGFKNWTFMSVAHWGEKGVGEWKLQVHSTTKDNNVKFNHWKLRLFGESIDASKAEPYDFKNDGKSESPKKPLLLSDVDRTTAQVTQTAVGTHPTVSPTGTSTVPSIAPTSTQTEQSEQTEHEASSTANTNSSELPTHEKPILISSPGKALHYFSAIFAVGAIFVLLYFFTFVKSKRRIRRSRAETYEFDIIDTDSEYDSTLNSQLSTNDPIANATDIDDFDFDLSEEDNLLRDSEENVQNIDNLLQSSSSPVEGQTRTNADETSDVHNIENESLVEVVNTDDTSADNGDARNSHSDEPQEKPFADHNTAETGTK